MDDDGGGDSHGDSDKGGGDDDSDNIDNYKQSFILYLSVMIELRGRHPCSNCIGHLSQIVL